VLLTAAGGVLIVQYLLRLGSLSDVGDRSLDRVHWLGYRATFVTADQRPSVHQPASPLKGVAASVSLLKLIADRMGQCRFRDLTGEIRGLAGPIPE
jgi:hypothetical protein